jgi:phospholipase/carboxylesterase
MAILLLLLTLSFPGTGLATPGEIDPSDPSSGDFLDLDLSEYYRIAGEAYRDGNYNLAIRYYLASLNRNIDNEIAIYNVACCYALMGNVELASLYLQRAVIAGYHDIDFMRGDHDFDGVRDDPLFIGTMQHISAALGEAPEYTGDEYLFHAEAAFRCLLRFPEEYDPEREYPLVVGLHGYGDSPENFIRIWEYFDEPDFIYACPRGPYPFTENNVTAFSWFKPYDDEYDIRELDLLSTEYVISLVDDLRERHLISDVFLFGFSQGCALTWMTGLTHPEIFTGLIGFGGRLDTTFVGASDWGDATGLNAFAANGTMDQAAPVEAGLEAVEILENLGIETVFSSWEGVHMVNRPVLLQAQEWMETLRR